MYQNLQENQPPAVKSRFFYGYVIAIAAFCICFAAFGIRFSYGVFFTPMSVELGWSNATTALAFSISVLMEGIFNIILGGVTDKYGPRRVLTISGLLIGLGYCLMPLVHSTWQFYVFYGLIVGIGMGGIFVPLIAVIARWFKVRRSLMSGLVISGNSVGLLVISPLATQLIITEGWRSAFLIIGIAIIVIITVAAQFLKRDPSVMGLRPDGKQAGTEQAELTTGSGSSLKEAFKSYRLWLVFGIFFCLGFFMVGNQIYIVPDAISIGMSSTTAAYILSTLGGVNVVGLIVLGAAADKIGNRRIYLSGFASYLLASLVVVTHQVSASFFIYAVIAGLAGGGLASAMSPLVASLFGLKSHGLIFGFCGFGCTLGQAAGPYIVGSILDYRSNYSVALSACVIAAVIGLILIVLLKPMKNSWHGSARF